MPLYQYSRIIRDNNITGAVLASDGLGTAEWMELGLPSVGHIVRLRTAASALSDLPKSTTSAPLVATPPPTPPPTTPPPTTPPPGPSTAIPGFTEITYALEPTGNGMRFDVGGGQMDGDEA